MTGRTNRTSPFRPIYCGTDFLTLQRHGLDGEAYTIHFFLGAPPSASDVAAGQASLIQLPRHVGLVYTFSGSYGRRDGAAPSRANCEKQQGAGALARASVPLTIPLYCAAADREIPHLGSSAVQPYLKDNLSWIAVSVRCSCSYGSTLAKQWLTNASVFLVSREAVLLSHGMF